jgi:hypothetical protein
MSFTQGLACSVADNGRRDYDVGTVGDADDDAFI